MSPIRAARRALEDNTPAAWAEYAAALARQHSCPSLNFVYMPDDDVLGVIVHNPQPDVERLEKELGAEAGDVAVDVMYRVPVSRMRDLSAPKLTEAMVSIIAMYAAHVGPLVDGVEHAQCCTIHGTHTVPHKGCVLR